MLDWACPWSPRLGAHHLFEDSNMEILTKHFPCSNKAGCTCPNDGLQSRRLIESHAASHQNRAEKQSCSPLSEVVVRWHAWLQSWRWPTLWVYSCSALNPGGGHFSVCPWCHSKADPPSVLCRDSGRLCSVALLLGTYKREQQPSSASKGKTANTNRITTTEAPVEAVHRSAPSSAFGQCHVEVSLKLLEVGVAVALQWLPQGLASRRCWQISSWVLLWSGCPLTIAWISMLFFL